MTNITEALITEHAVFTTVFDQIERVLPKLDSEVAIKMLGTMVEGLLHDHADTENNMAFAALDHVMAHKGKLDQFYHEHEEIGDSFKRVQAAGSVAEARKFLKAALAASRQHFRHEEKTVFPLMEKNLKPEIATALGKTWLQRYTATARA
jgi:hemerythrin-like domain-containing protein